MKVIKKEINPLGQNMWYVWDIEQQMKANLIKEAFSNMPAFLLIWKQIPRDIGVTII